MPDILMSKPKANRSWRAAKLAAHMPDAQFNRLMELFIEKEDPNRVIGWPTSPIPTWAKDYRPQVFLDIGCGLGAVTTSVLRRLHDWGCLAQLREVVLVDNDAALHEQGALGLKAYLEDRIGRVLEELGRKDVAVTAHVETLSLVPVEAGAFDLAPLGRICPSADMILASHVTYYFGNGSGEELTSALVRRLSTSGLMWIDIRDLDCPVYRARRELLDRIGVVEPRPFDYAEYFEDVVIPGLSSVSLVERARVQVPTRPGTDLVHAAMLMMWRGELRGGSRQERQMIEAAVKVAQTTSHLYSESQFIIAHSR